MVGRSNAEAKRSGNVRLFRVHGIPPNKALQGDGQKRVAPERQVVRYYKKYYLSLKSLNRYFSINVPNPSNGNINRVVL